MIKINLRGASLALLAALVAVTVLDELAFAEDNSNKPIVVVVPFPPGGSADIVARVISRELETTLGKQLIIENKPGGDGAVAAVYVANSKPDGNTLFMATYGAMSAVPAMHQHVDYDVLRDFTPISYTGTFSLFLFVHPSLPVYTIKELITYAKAHPGSLNYGTGNTSSILAMAELSSNEKLEMIHVPYKGEVLAMADFLANRIQMMVATPTNASPWVKEGKLRVIVTFQNKRSPLFPDTPTMKESGFKSLSILPWAGLFGPHDLPKPLAIKLSKAVSIALENQNVQAELSKEGFSAAGSTQAQLAKTVKDQLTIWSRAVRAASIPIE